MTTFTMPNLFVLFNHTLTAAQEADARAALGVVEIVLPPDEIRRLWSRVPPDSETLSGYLAPVRAWLAGEAGPGDFVLVQGEFGATFLMVSFCLKRGLVPVYSTTDRQAVEKRLPGGTVRLQHVFRHVRFPRYGL